MRHGHIIDGIKQEIDRVKATFRMMHPKVNRKRSVELGHGLFPPHPTAYGYWYTCRDEMREIYPEWER